MKQLFILSAFSFAFFFCSVAQNIDYAAVTVSYTKLPLKPLDKSVKNYQVSISMDYIAKIEQKKKEHAEKVAAEEVRYQTAMKNYEEQVKQAAIKYQQDMMAWNKLNAQQQAVTPKPQMPIIAQPEKMIIQEEPYEKVFDVDYMASTMIGLEGYNRLPDNALKIHVSLLGFDNEAPKVVPKSSQQKKDNATITVTTYAYQFNYRHQVKLKVTLPNGTTVVDEYFAPSLSYRTYTSKEFNTQAEADMYWMSNKNYEMAALQEKAVKENLNAINEHLNDQHGYRKTARSFYVTWVNEKSGYDDYRDALTNAKNGYAIIGNKESFNSASESLLKAIEIWEKAMLESNPKNKKARVDEDVTEATLLNLIEAYAWLNNFDKAQQYHSQLMTFKLSAKEKGYASNAHYFISEQRKRADANK